MSEVTQLDGYLRAFHLRLARLLIARGAAAVAAAALGVTLAGAYLSIRTGYASEVVISARIVLLLLIGVGVVWLIILPTRRIERTMAKSIEARTPAFAGRVETYLGAGQPPNPLAELLAEDTLEVARHFPVDRQIRARQIAIPGILGATCIALLVWLAIAGLGLMNFGVRHLWAGWAFAGLLPPQNILVTPGDEVVRRGGNLTIRADPEGFDPAQVSLHVRIGDSDWQEVDMAREAAIFEFTLFSIREPLDYFVSAAGVRTPAFDVKVVDLPNVENFRLTYRYPEWTRRPPETMDPGGDIRTIADTQIELEVITDKPLAAVELVLNDENMPLATEGRNARRQFTISEDGQYFIAARVGGEQVRLTDDYFITLLEDQKPEIQLIRPGRDWRANRIEEVTVQVDATDDFGLKSLELRYALNGGEWQSVPLSIEDREFRVDHVFMLEAMGPGNDAAAQDESGAMVPGDLIAYYALATDREQTARSDMFFIEVQPFDRRYSQSQQMGGAGGGQGQSQQEISQRQKQILVSTWNLIREQSEASEVDGISIEDNATLLSELQTTLGDQAQSLARRTRARQLIDSEERIAQFVKNMEQATEAMRPAAERLAAIDLEQAIQPEQQALQHLLRAEAVFTDIRIAFQRGAMNDGFQAGRDLADMFDLEMDLEKNQYETGNFASPDSPSREFTDTMRQLEEMARRQEQLTNNLGHQRNPTPAHRWQQEMLRREAEELRQRLADLQRRHFTNSQSGGQASSQAGGDPGQSEIDRRLASAIRAMTEAANSTGNSDPENQGTRQASREAHRQLEGVLDEVAREQRRAMQNWFADAARQAAHLYEEQARIDQELQHAVRQALTERKNTGRPDSGLTPERQAELAGRKRLMLEELQRLERDMQDAARRYRNSAPEATRELDAAADAMRNAAIETRLAIAVQYLEDGAAGYVTSSESGVTRALREFRDNLARAQALAAGSTPPSNSDLNRVLARTRALRGELQQLTNSQVQGFGDSWTTGAMNERELLADPPSPNPETQYRIGRDIEETAGAVRRLIPELRNLGFDPREIDAVRELTRQLDLARFTGNTDLLKREADSALHLLEQLELRLSDAVEADGDAAVRTAVAERVPTEYKGAVAEYYRRLSRE